MLSSDSALLLLTTNFQDVRQITRLKRLFFSEQKRDIENR